MVFDFQFNLRVLDKGFKLMRIDGLDGHKLVILFRLRYHVRCFISFYSILERNLLSFMMHSPTTSAMSLESKIILLMNSKDADQLALKRRRICDIGVSCLHSIITSLPRAKISGI